MGRKAVIDIGSNSVKLFVGERTADGTIATVLDASAITRLGEGLDRTGLIGPEAMERSAAAVAAFHARAADHPRGGRGPAVLSGGPVRPAPAGRGAGGVRHRRRLHGVRLRRGRPAR